MIKKIKKLLEIQAFATILAIVVIVVAVILTNVLYQAKPVIKRGFEIKISADGKVVPRKEKKIVDLATVMKSADFDRGKKIFKKCSSCHTSGKGGASKIGPNLYKIVGRKKASFSGFSYSDAMKEKGGSWNQEALNLFITKPKKYVPGTKMAFPGLKKPQDRADIILYLKSSK